MCVVCGGRVSPTAATCCGHAHIHVRCAHSCALPVVIIRAAAAKVVYFVVDPAIESPAAVVAHILIAPSCAKAAETVLALG